MSFSFKNFEKDVVTTKERINVANLRAGVFLAWDAYVLNNNNELVKVLRRGEKITEEFIDKLKRYNIKEMYYSKLPENQNTNSIDTKIFENLYNLYKNIDNSIANNKEIPVADIGNAIVSLTEAIKKTVEEKKIICLLEANNAEDVFYIHSINVAMLAITMGIVLRYSDQKLANLGKAAFLHDIGKLYLKHKLPGLDKNEVFLKHPQAGYELLQNVYRYESTRPILEFILQHHENYDGSGFPAKLRGDDIQEEAQLISVCDTFDGMENSNNPMPLWKMIITIKEEIEHKFNSKYANIFINIISRKLYIENLFDKGNFVRLNTNELAEIIESNDKIILEPVINIIINEKHQALRRPIRVDLSYDKSRFIISLITNPKLLDAIKQIKAS